MNSLMAPHLRLFAAAWIGYLALTVLVPVRYGSLRAADAAFGMLLFFLLALLIAAIVDALCQRGASRPHRPLSPRDARSLILVSLALSFVGFALLAVDKVFIQHIDFSQGIAVARQLWRREAEARSGGISSIFSVLGYLLGFTFFVAAALTHLHWERLSARLRRWSLASVAFLVIANSVLTGGRSIILMQMAAFVATGAFRALAGRPFLPGRILRGLIASILAIALALAYSVYVFSERAATQGIDAYAYSTGMLGYLGGTPTASYAALDDLPEGVSGVLQFGVIAGAYLTHSYGTFESVLEMESTPGNASLVFARVLLARLGLGPPIEEEWILTGRFISLPGALWYDFGWPGLVFGALALGMLLGLVRFLLSGTRAPLCGTMLGLCIATLVSGVVSPLLLAADMLAFPFMLIGFVTMDVVALLIGAGGIWSTTGRVGRIVARDAEKCA